MVGRAVDLSVVIPALNEGDNLKLLLPQLQTMLEKLGVAFEILVLDGGSTDDSRAVSERAGVRFLRQSHEGYGIALREGFEAARGEYVLTMDADYSHEPAFIDTLWKARERADMLVASRYVDGGSADMSYLRGALSRILNSVYRRALDLSYRDLCSGFRLYRQASLQEVSPKGTGFDFLPEILVLLYTQGFRIKELPFHYRARKERRSRAKLVHFGWTYLRTLFRMRQLRTSVQSADYDGRAFSSLVPVQRYWQRKRYRIVMGYLEPDGRVLDVGCGSSRIIQGLTQGVGLDTQLNKLRYLRGRATMLVAGSLTHLPFREGAFKQMVCSEVIEHVPRDQVRLSEFHRVLAPGGTLILGTPDYSSWIWNAIEWVYGFCCPGGYAGEHINHYTEKGLRKELEANGFIVDELNKICRSEMIFRAIKTSF